MKKLTRNKILAICCAIISLLIVIVIYGSEYTYSENYGDLENAIETFVEKTPKGLPSMKDINDFKVRIFDKEKYKGSLKGTHIVYFTANDNTGYIGEAVFKQGINFRYRIVHINYSWGSIGKAELFFLEIGCLIVLAISIFITRHFWIKKPLSESEKELPKSRK